MTDQTESLPPFSENTHCPKCFGEDVTVRWIGQASTVNGHCGYNAHCSERGEHLDRRCKRCGFCWPEACEDTPRPASADRSTP